MSHWTYERGRKRLPSQNGKRGGTRRTSLVQAQIAIGDETFRRVRGACSEFSAGSIDLDEHAANITLEIHKARAFPRLSYPAFSLMRVSSRPARSPSEGSADGAERE